MKLTRLFAVLALLLPMVLHAAPKEKKLEILATFPPIYSLTANVAGDAAHVEQLLPPGAEPHHFALSPRDLRKIAKADVIVENGLRMEDWLTNALKGSRAVRVTASRGIRTDDGNPHVWLDPVLAIKQVENIRDGLAKVDPANKEIYKRNAAAYIGRLKKLNSEIASVTSTFPDKRLMTGHAAFHYFAKRYGFEVVGVFGDAHGHEPSPRELRRLRKTIKDENVRVLFVDSAHSPRVMKTIAKEMNLALVELDPMEMSRPSADVYEKVMRANLKQLRGALGGRR